MNGQNVNPTEQAHQSLRNILLNGRILINGFPPTATEMGNVIQGEQILFEKASMLDKANALAASKKTKTPQEPKPYDSSQPKKK